MLQRQAEEEGRELTREEGIAAKAQYGAWFQETRSGMPSRYAEYSQRSGKHGYEIEQSAPLCLYREFPA